MNRSLVIKVTVGQEAPEKCAQGFTVAATAVSAGAFVSLWVTGEASWLVLPGRAEAFTLPHSAPLAELRDQILVAGTITLCSQCALRRGISEADVVPGVRLAGAALFVAEIMTEGAQALLY